MMIFLLCALSLTLGFLAGIFATCVYVLGVIVTEEERARRTFVQLSVWAADVRTKTPKAPEAEA